MAPAGTASCARHAEAQAVDVCARCGSFVCGDCLELREERPYCSDCFSRALRGKPSGVAIVALGLSLLGLVCGFPFGIAALLVSSSELKAIDRGESPEAGRDVARGARMLGFISLGLSALVALALLGLHLRG